MSNTRPETFGQRLRRLRLQRGLSIKEMAQQIGVAVSTYRDWEYGRVIRGEPYMKIAAIHKIGLTELLTGEIPDKNGIAHDLRSLREQIAGISQKLTPLLEGGGPSYPNRT